MSHSFAQVSSHTSVTCVRTTSPAPWPWWSIEPSTSTWSSTSVDTVVARSDTCLASGDIWLHTLPRCATLVVNVDVSFHSRPTSAHTWRLTQVHISRSRIGSVLPQIIWSFLPWRIWSVLPWRTRYFLPWRMWSFLPCYWFDYCFYIHKGATKSPEQIFLFNYVYLITSNIFMCINICFND